ncbi:protein MALE DISCOVERER 2-like isoform X2 [Phragmites australis]|uniref:protein MALE DISCOVERER 2-like isoform X2 n=1 Tax=Phragmites australis TaxID=29695 RepID=UPI002D78F34F|nr:protein MALE DISCOVERER 2-like isoform X2 [Phragmites australis]
MEPPLLRRLLMLLVSVSWLLLAHGSAAIGDLEDGDAGRWSTSSIQPASHLGNFRNVHTRRLLQKLAAFPQPPTHTPVHKKHKSHRRSQVLTPVPAPTPSPFIAPPKASPAPSASAPAISPLGSHPLASPPHPLSPLPSTPQANHDPEADPPVHSLHKHSLRNYGLVTAGSAVFLVMAAASVMYCRAKKVGTVRPWATGLSGQLQRAFVTGVPALKRSELEAACEDFSNIIGATSSCMLYKGTLSSGVEIAVVSSSIISVKDWSKECESHYRKKITSLSKVSHKNFMNLLGYCEEDHSFIRAMVFEYAPNGTLFEHLHVREAENLDWTARLRISMGIAYCLEHMHQLNPPVVPRNFDSSTIYLTDDFAAKVSDLDFWSDTKGYSSNSGTDDSTISDIDSMVHQYGMILLEILTGKLPISEEDGSLEQWASRYFDGNMPLAELIDSSLSSFPEEPARALCEVARSCIDSDPKKRPQMAQVAARMKEITALGPEKATPKVSPLWWAELEIMSSEAS